jgi:putative aminopeptidase FrvX
MLSGHIDEIGLMITHIDDQGFLCFTGIGSWDPQVLVGQRVLIQTGAGEVPGIIGEKAIHLMEAEERKKVSQIKDLWLDIGAKDSDEAKEMVRVGDMGVLDQNPSRSLDNRIGAVIVLEALRLLSEEDGIVPEVVAVASVQQEIGPTRSSPDVLG